MTKEEYNNLKVGNHVFPVWASHPCWELEVVKVGDGKIMLDTGTIFPYKDDPTYHLRRLEFVSRETKAEDENA